MELSSFSVAFSTTKEVVVSKFVFSVLSSLLLIALRYPVLQLSSSYPKLVPFLNLPNRSEHSQFSQVFGIKISSLTSPLFA